MARRYLEVGEIIPPGAWCKSFSGPDLIAEAAGCRMERSDVGNYYIEVPGTLPPEVIALMTQIKAHLASAQQLMQTLETRLNTMETSC